MAFRKPGKKAKCVYNTINPQESFTFSLSLSVFFLSAAFCDFIADIVQESLPRAIFSFAGSTRATRAGKTGPSRLLCLWALPVFL